ncbi:MAG: Na/Pi symporter [Actinobacteria bacterium]|nr:Na/Pi symporter [Actinomycetota bacterium]
MPAWARALLVIGLLYLFLVGVGLLSDGIKALGSGFQEGLLESVTNPVAGMFAGILATVLVQSSSVSTATIVGMVGAGTLSIEAAVPMIMGANIGTSVTNTLASIGHVRRREEFRRAFAGATVHDFFNLLAVAIFLPLEILTGILSTIAQELADVLSSWGVQGGESDSVIKAAVGAGEAVVERVVGVLGTSGTVLGVVLLAVGLGLIFLALSNITRNMRQLIAGQVETAMNRMIGSGGGVVAILIGIVITVLVQSSSITTSILVPLVAAGILSLENAYPITLGANVGTTVTALLASLAVDLQAGLVVAIVHTLFNVAGILVFYPVPAMRRVPIRLARGLSDVAYDHRSLVFVYVLGAFVVLPLSGMLILR